MQVPLLLPTRIDILIRITLPGGHVKLNYFAVTADVSVIAGIVCIFLIGDAVQWLVKVSDDVDDELQGLCARAGELALIRENRLESFSRQERTVTTLVVHATFARYVKG